MITYRHFLAAVCCFFISITAFAEEYIFKMDTVLKSVQNAAYGKLRVIDMRSVKDNIGELKTGAFNRTKPIITEGPLPEFLSSYYGRMIKGHRNEDAELLLILYSMEIVDRANGGEIGTFYFDGDFYGGSNNMYAFLGTVDSIYEASSSWDVTQALLKATKYKISEILGRYASQQLETNTNFSEQQAVSRRQVKKNDYPIYTTSRYKKGIYYTAEQFLNNAPIDTPFIKSVIYPTGGRREIYFYYKNEKGKKGKPIKTDAYFAIYDGADWGVPGHFCAEKMRYENGEFYAHLPFRGVNDKAQAMLVGYALGGVIGAAVANAAADGTTWGIYKARFDPETKTFIPQKRIY